MGMSDLQFKDSLRKDLIMIEHFKELLEANKVEELRKAIEKQIERINQSLQG